MAHLTVVKFSVIVTVCNLYKADGLDQLVWQESVEGSKQGMKPVRKATAEAYKTVLAEYAKASNVVVCGSYFGKVSDDPDQWAYGALRGWRGVTKSRHGWFKHRTRNTYVTTVDSEAGLGSWIHVQNIPSQNKHLLLPIFGDDWLAHADIPEPLKRFG